MNHRRKRPPRISPFNKREKLDSPHKLRVRKKRSSRLPLVSVVGIRSHKITETEETIFKELSAYFSPENIYYVIDATSHSKEEIKLLSSEYPNMIYFTKSSLESMELKHDFPKIGWRCGDYFYYFLQESVKADHYWLVESDVRFTFEDIASFFAPFEKINKDFIIPKFAKASRDWGWFQRGQQVAKDVYQGLFPITRVSFRFVEDLLKERQKLTKRFNDSDLEYHLWPNDESFVCTLAIRLSYSVLPMDIVQPNAFDFFSANRPYLYASAKKHLPENSVIHPALDEDAFFVSLKQKMNSPKNWESLVPILQTSLLGLATQELEQVKAIVTQTIEKKIDQNHLMLKRFHASPHNKEVRHGS